MLELFLQQAVVVLAAAVAVLLVCHRLRIPPLVGLLVTGMLLGPSVTGLVADDEAIHLLAEIGVVLLLFAIGLELSLAQLATLRRPFLVGGSLHALLVAGGAALAARGLGIATPQALFLGFVLALSSTALVLKLQGDRRETETPHGQTALAILLFQDFLIVPMIVLTPVLGGAVAASPAQLALRFGGALAAIALLVVVARRLVPWFFALLVGTRVREAFVLGALGTCLALATLTHAMGFSLALGAFLAGLLVSETEYSHQVFADVAPFRDLFASVFFVSIGLLVDLEFAVSNLPAVLGLAAGIVALKTLAGVIAVSALRFPARTVAAVALSLAQIGEFSFVLMEVGRQHGLLEGGRYQLLLAAAVATLLLTPALVAAGPAAGRLWYRLTRPGRPAEPAVPADASLSGHVIIVGHGVAGSLLARVLRETRIPYVVIELNGETVRRRRAEGEPMIYGDATRREILEHAGVARATAIVFAITDPAAVLRAVSLARDLNHSLEIIVRTRRVDEIEEVTRRGADQVVAEEFETAIEIFTRVLARFHVPRNVVRAQTRALRGEGYRMLRSRSLAEGATEAVLAALEAGGTEVVRVEAASPAAGRTLKDLDLRRRTGATVIAVVRDGRHVPNPSPDVALEPGDDLVLVGSHAELDRAIETLE